MSAKVFDELTCPDCGGQIGGTPTPGAKPCTCFDDKPQVRRARLPDEPDPIDMRPLVAGGAEHEAGQVVEAKPGQKLCRVCGKNLAGRTRMKDEKGYICKACSDAEFAVEAEAERDAMQCPECKRKLKPAAFVEYRGSLICKRCKADHDETDKLRVGKVALTKHAEEEKRSVLIYVIVTAVLLLIAVIATLLNR